MTCADPRHGVCAECDPGMCRRCGRNLLPAENGRCNDCEPTTCHVCHAPLGGGDWPDPCPDHHRPTCSNCCGCDAADIMGVAG